MLNTIKNIKNKKIIRREKDLQDCKQSDEKKEASENAYKEFIANHDSNNIVDLQGIVKRFYIGKPNELEILHGMNLTVKKSEFVSIIGASGSGKTTLMNIIGVLDRPTEGNYLLDGIDISKAKDNDLSRIRNEKIGFVFQTYNLVARTSALMNVELPMLYGGVPAAERRRRAIELLELVDMGDRASHTPDELSGGQKQRVAIARALANNPAIILADEPTGALDSKTGRMIMDLFHKLNKEQGITVILITHSPELAEETQRIIVLKDGEIIGERQGSSSANENETIGDIEHNIELERELERAREELKNGQA